MENKMDYTPEEIQEMIEKAQRDLQETLDKMTPEEREEFEHKAQQALEEDNARIQGILDDAKKIMAETSSEEKPKPRFCTNCGAPAGEGKFCTYCGNQL